MKTTVEKIEEFLRKIKSVKSAKSSKEAIGEIKKFKENFYRELDDDFNTPQAFAVLFDFLKSTNSLLEQDLVSKKQAFEIYKFFEEINDIFGVIDFKKVNQAIPAEIKKLVKARELQRKNKEWQKSDETRDEIEKHGYTVEDTKDGPVVKKI